MTKPAIEMTETPDIAILGGGAWGTALAIALAHSDLPIHLWMRSHEQAKTMASLRINQHYLPHVVLPENIIVTPDMATLSSCNLVVLACPAQQLSSLLSRAKDHLAPDVTILNAAKGIDQESGKLPHEKIKEFMPHATIGALSGPSFASEVAHNKPTALTLAMDDLRDAEKWAQILSCPTFRLYPHDDVLGVEIGGAMKNVIALACGIAEGRGMGQNARAALMTRGLAEITQLGMVMGAKAETFQGLSGMGDLVLTCSSPSSRNFHFGLLLGQGRSLDHLLQNHLLTEGYYTSKALRVLCQKHNLDLPICQTLYEVLYAGKNLDSAIQDLLARPITQEIKHGLLAV